MKKLLALVFALMLCLTVAHAETIEVEMVQLTGGLCFPVPADWTELELDADDREEGYVLMTMDEITGRCMALVVEDMGEGVTTADVAEILQSSSDYAGANLVTNGHGMEFALYALADQTMVSYAFVDENGQMYNFSFLNAEGKKVSGDTALLELVDTSMAETCYADAVEEEAEEAAAPVTAGSIPLETYTLDKTIAIALPADWTEQELSEEEKDEGYAIILLDEENERGMLVMATELGDITTAQLAD